MKKSHLKMIGMLKPQELSEHQQHIMDEKRAQFEVLNAVVDQTDASDLVDNPFLKGASVCMEMPH